MADRRDLLRGFVALPFAAAPVVAVSSRALAGSADPFSTYHQRILAIHTAVEAAPNDEAAERLMDAWGDVDHEALAGCPTTLAGAAGALEYARREFVQFQVHDDEATADPSKRLILHLLDGALDVLRQAAMGGAS
jgi:hypothetical protein